MWPGKLNDILLSHIELQAAAPTDLPGDADGVEVAAGASDDASAGVEFDGVVFVDGHCKR